MARRVKASTGEPKRARQMPAEEQYALRLYVAGMTPKSTRAVENIRRICEHYLAGRYDLEVIDIFQQPRLAEGDQIVAAPTLVKKLPIPLRRLIGDLSNEEKVLIGLDLKRIPSEKPPQEANGSAPQSGARKKVQAAQPPGGETRKFEARDGRPLGRHDRPIPCVATSARRVCAAA